MARHQPLFEAWKHADTHAESPTGRFEKPDGMTMDESGSTLLRLKPDWRTDIETAIEDLELAGLVTRDKLEASTAELAARIEALAEPAVVSPEPTTTNPEDLYIVSDWPATQTSRIRWLPENVVFHDDGTFDLILRESPEGIQRPYTSGEVASVETAVYGKWEWQVQIPDMVSGSVFGMFLFQADASTRRIEYDLEFVGSDTNSIEINIHMQDDAGRMHRLIGGPITVDLPFDAAEGMHSYEIEVLENEVVFRADGQEIGRFGPEDMPQGVWRTGEVRAYTDLWAVSPGGQEYWAGVWPNPTEPLVAKVGMMEGPADDAPGSGPLPDATILGTLGADVLDGTDATDRIDGRDGDDRIDGRAGDDVVHGGSGNDSITLDLGNDGLDGGTGEDWIAYAGRKNISLDLAQQDAQRTGLGTDVVRNVEHLTGGRGHDSLSGASGDNALDGGAGNDRLWGREGADSLTGGLGADRLDGGTGADVFIFRSAAESSLRSGDVILSFGEDDLLDLSGLSPTGPLAFSTGSAALSVWTAESRRGTEVYADTDGDARSDFRVTLWDGFTLDASDVLL